MVQEAWREGKRADGGSSDPDSRFEEIANLHRAAPRMDLDAVNTPLAVGSVAPDFELVDANNEKRALKEFRGRPLVLAFYPLDWSPTCSDQLTLYQSEMAEFERHGAQVVGISVDSFYSHAAWAAVRGITFPLLSDFEPKGEVARKYNAYRPEEGFTERALYVLDADGVIRYAYVSPKVGHMPDIYELYRALSDITGQPVPRSSEDPSGTSPAGIKA
jgi:peroxiredoxin